MPYLPSMRLILCFLLLPTAAQAWTFTPGPVCRLEHKTPTARIELTYDPSQPLYSVTVTSAPLPGSPFFSMTFEGAQGQTISTNRHTTSPDGTQVTVTDTGFGNVLDGLQFNDVALAVIGDSEIAFPLKGAAPAVAAFRQCAPAAGV